MTNDNFNTGLFFDINGIISFETLDELERILSEVTPEFYLSKMESIKKNYDKSKEYLLAEDWIYKNTKIFNI
jgi:hypothetical protein